MRTLVEVKESITTDFMNNEAAAELYGFHVGDNFYDHFRQTSIESILFSVFASAIWILEGMFNIHKAEVNSAFEQMRPHRPVWYRNKMLAFMKDKTLIPDTDIYDTSKMSDTEITNARVIKHAVAVENEDASITTIKVAGETNGVRGKFDAETESQIWEYIKKIKDTGVRISLINADPDVFNCTFDIYYDAMLVPEDVRVKCEQTIKAYIENLPFNGKYTNMDLVDKLQALDGVQVPEFKGANTTSDISSAVMDIDAIYVPYAGYFKAGTLSLNMKAYE